MKERILLESSSPKGPSIYIVPTLAQSKDVGTHSRPRYMLYYMIPYHAIPYYTIPCHIMRYYTMPHHALLYYTVLDRTVLCCCVLCYTILYYAILFYTILYYTILYYTILYSTLLYCTLLYYTPIGQQTAWPQPEAPCLGLILLCRRASKVKRRR